VLTPGAIDELVKKGKIAAGSRKNIARVGVGVVVKEGAARPDIATVDAFKRALLAAKSVAYIDPEAGGSSGIYVADLLVKLGIADQIKPKAVLIHGGAVAEHIAKGEAELGIHQVSEILPVKGITLVGPLPQEIQNYTTYAAGLGADSKVADAAKALIGFLSDPKYAPAIRKTGMEPAGS
jgi:molybdate transport system substrate-binding protein